MTKMRPDKSSKKMNLVIVVVDSLVVQREGVIQASNNHTTMTVSCSH